MFNSYRNFAICILIILVLIALCQLKKERISKCPLNYLQVTVTYLILYSPLKKKVYLFHQLIIIIINAIYLRYLILCYTNLFSELSRESHGRAFREGDFI